MVCRSNLERSSLAGFRFLRSADDAYASKRKGLFNAEFDKFPLLVSELPGGGEVERPAVALAKPSFA